MEGVTVAVSVRPKLSDSSETVVLQWSVQDTGMGMTSDQQVHLFKAYAQADTSTARRFGGTGLGLMICRQLVELMGGIITVNSRFGEAVRSPIPPIFFQPFIEIPQYLRLAPINEVQESRGGRCASWSRMTMKSIKLSPVSFYRS